ncbi:MAG TPA: hypothetical protein VFW71_00035 [Actinomycetota bacterium]|nr:hypothetical protein [Actinomycetota bacterium]
MAGSAGMGGQERGGRCGRALLAAGVVVALVATGCTRSRISSDATVTVSGSVVDASGSPVPGAKVALVKEADLGEVLGGLTLALSKLGLSCFVAHQPSFCARARRATTDSSGSFAYTLSGADTQGSVGNADTLDVTAVGPGGAAAGGTTVAFTVQTATLALPALRLWGATPGVATGGGPQPSYRVTWPDLPSSIGGSASYGVRFVDGAAGASGDDWAVRGARSGTTVDGRVLEDRSGNVEVDAATSAAGPHTTFRFTYRSATVAFHGPGAPPSRGAGCLVQPGGGAPVALHPCPLTDGNLSTGGALAPSPCAGCTPAGTTAAIIDLGTPRPLGLVVVRGATTGVAIEGSNDLSSWSMLGSLDADLGATAVHGSARYIRVRSLSGLGLGGLAEVSVW